MCVSSFSCGGGGVQVKFWTEHMVNVEGIGVHVPCLFPAAGLVCYVQVRCWMGHTTTSAPSPQRQLTFMRPEVVVHVLPLRHVVVVVRPEHQHDRQRDLLVDDAGWVWEEGVSESR